MRRRFVRDGFTLMELLIAIAIIALLISILFPAISRAREMAARAVCLSNIRQLQVAWLAYADANKGRFCTAAEVQRHMELASPRPEDKGGWLTLLDISSGGSVVDFPNSRIWPYIRDVRAFYCPNDARDSVNGKEALFYGKPFTTPSYGMSGYMGLWGLLPAAPAGISNISDVQKMTRLSDIRHSERTLVFMEVPIFIGSIDIDQILPPTYPQLMPAQLAATFHRNGRFTEGATVSFADGHAIFWSYTMPIALQDHMGVLKLPREDRLQLAGWNGVQNPPPGVIP